MSSSINSVSDIVEAIPALSGWLHNMDSYHAHTHVNKVPEKLAEHVALVNKYFAALCKVHELDPALDKLIYTIARDNFPIEVSALVANKIKEAFVMAIHFHDLGKVNENFQAEKMKNPLFKVIPAHPISSKHSALGAYLFVMDQIQGTTSLNISDEDKNTLFLIILLLSYSILKHHSSKLSEPLDSEIKFEEADCMSMYLKMYRLEIHENLTKYLPLNIQVLFTDFDLNLKQDFPLFALLKLQFSLLTAADYLATHEYMADAPTTDLGVFCERKRERVEEIIHHLRNYGHNKDIYDKLESFEFQRPQERSKDNLNQLRTEMAVEVIHSIRANKDQKLFYIEAPTGGGKTNLSMIAVTELLESDPSLTKVFYVFPFTTLITQTFQSLKDNLGLRQAEIAQLHSKAAFPSKEGEKDGEYGKEKKDFIDYTFALYPITVLSHVRFFDILKSNRKEVNYLLHRLANSVVVIDELQSYDPGIWDIMLYVISEYAEYFNIRFVLMSATLPRISGLQLPMVNKPEFTDLIPNADRYMKNANFAGRVNFRFELLPDKIEMTPLVEVVISRSTEYVRQISQHGSVHTIVEFIYKKSATEFYDTLKEELHPFDDILVLSGTILEHRRKEVINFLKNKANRHRSILLITTQVVEAGVDIDMDLGFKNVSLIDSDEQLAGRVNRNADKEEAEVYLFKMDNARVLYGKDLRYKAMHEKINIGDHMRILQQKDFQYLYNEVLIRIDKDNGLPYSDNFENNFHHPVKTLNFNDVNENFKIIDQQNDTVFVPMPVPVKVAGIEDGIMDEVFTSGDLEFLQQFDCYMPGDNEVNGAEVWKIYEGLVSATNKGFDLGQKVNFKILQAIMSKFTFSLIKKAKVNMALRSYCRNGDNTFGYLVLDRYQEVYTIDGGLNEKHFREIEDQMI